MDLLNTLDPHWGWLALGLVLAIGEMVIPGVFLIWLAGAALLTGLVAWAVPTLGVPLEIVIFAVLAIIGVYLGRNWLRANPIVGADPLLNDRGGQLVGETVTVTTAIDGGTGRVRVGDSEWGVRGPDAGIRA
jgi:membrane protein implicated in regulation of membrane protease activity